MNRSMKVVNCLLLVAGAILLLSSCQHSQSTSSATYHKRSRIISKATHCRVQRNCATGRAHPIVDINGFLVGGTINGRWLSSRQMVKYVKGNECYSTYRGIQFTGSSIGSKPDTNFRVKMKPDSIGLFAVASCWDVLPRKIKISTTHKPADETTIRLFLKAKGLSKSPVRIEESIRSDIDDDGRDEKIITAGSMDPSSYNIGDYSIVVLCTYVMKKPTTRLVAGDYHTRDDKKNVPRYYKLLGLYDLDGDSKLEIVVTYSAPLLESQCTEIYKVVEGQPILVAAVRPNYDYSLE